MDNNTTKILSLMIVGIITIVIVYIVRTTKYQDIQKIR